MLTKLSYTKFISYNTNMNSNIRNLGIIFVTLAMVVGVASMAPVQSVQAEWLDVEDFGCVGVNNCNPETCTDTSAVDVGSAQEQSVTLIVQVQLLLHYFDPHYTFHMYCR